MYTRSRFKSVSSILPGLISPEVLIGGNCSGLGKGENKINWGKVRQKARRMFMKMTLLSIYISPNGILTHRSNNHELEILNGICANIPVVFHVVSKPFADFAMKILHLGWVSIVQRVNELLVE